MLNFMLKVPVLFRRIYRDAYMRIDDEDIYVDKEQVHKNIDQNVYYNTSFDFFRFLNESK